MKIKTVLIFALIVVSAISCKQETLQTEDILAKTNEHKLLKREVLQTMPLSLSSADSVEFVKKYVEDWLHTKLLYEKATDNIRNNDSVLMCQVERFREELFINTYEQLFLQQKLDTLIPQDAINEYYAKHKDEYLLENIVVKPVLIVFPKNSKNDIKTVEKLFFSKKIEDEDKLKDYCFQHCQKFSFADKWVEMSALREELPFGVRNENLTLNKGVKLSDTSNVYFVKITDQLSKGSRMPVELVHGKIAKILLQQRKVQLLKDMRSKVYQEASHKKQFEVYY